jgi:hypothetical protein
VERALPGSTAAAEGWSPAVGGWEARRGFRVLGEDGTGKKGRGRGIWIGVVLLVLGLESPVCRSGDL